MKRLYARGKLSPNRDGARDKIIQIVFLIPALTIFIVFFLYPVSTSVMYSFTDWNGISRESNFIWFDNYIEFFSNSTIFRTLPTTLYYAVLNMTVLTFGGFFVALALNRRSRFTPVLRLTFFIPMLVSGLIVGFVFREIYAPVLNEDNMGIINRLLTMVGLSGLRGNLLGNVNTAMIVVVLTGAWVQLGTTSMIYLAGMQIIPRELYETAEIDGAGYWRQVYHITWKMIVPSLSINMILLLVNSLKSYEMIFYLTQGGPGTATKVVNMSVMEFSVSAYKVGLGCAMSIIVALFIFVLVTVINVLLRRRERGIRE
ncbi:MAG: sugar ABC transporter permease [Oscillospiraceae bacterium]|nr:sugar ABC transporter permease [Oscillospiraceae bacterium]